MSIQKHKCLWLFILLTGAHAAICGAGTYSERSDVRFNHLTLENGLSQVSVYAMVQDRFGWMWLGTQDGLNRFDGHRVTVFRSDEGSLRLSDDWVRTLYEQPGGDLWIGTLNGGLNRYDRERERILFYQHDPNNPKTLSSNDIRYIWGDNGDRDILWIGARGSGLNKFHISTGEVERFIQEPPLNRNKIETIFEDSAGRLWIGSFAGLALFDRENGRFEHTALKGRVSDILELSSQPGYLWLSLRGEESGLCRYNIETGERTLYGKGTKNPVSDKLHDINSLYEDHSGSLWMGTMQGLFSYDPVDHSFQGFFHHPSNPNGLLQNTISGIYEDRRGVLWISTYTGGMHYSESSAFQFRHYTHIPNDQNSLTEPTIRSLTRDAQGNLWVATMTGGVNRFSPDMKEVAHFQHDPQDPTSLFTNEVHCIQAIGDQIWVGSDDAGLEQFDPSNNTFVHYSLQTENDRRSRGILYIHGDQTDESIIWACTYTQGLIRFNYVTGESRHYYPEPHENSLSDNMPVYILEESPELFWIGTIRGGLNLLNRETGQFKHFKPDPANPNSLSHQLVNSMTRDRSGTLWVCTGSGLNRMMGEVGKFESFTVKDGLPNNYIYGCLEDESGALWISSNGGLSRLDPQKMVFHNYTARDGLQSNEFNRGAFFKDQNGMMFFGGINGFNAFQPSLIQRASGKSPMMITRFSIQNQNITPQMVDSPLTRSLSVTKSVTLDHGQNDFAFEFAIMTFTNTDRNRYAYRLAPYNREWVETDAYNRIATYTNLDQGAYTFQVKAVDRYGVWSEATPISIRIQPAPWRSPLALAGYFSIFLALVFWTVSNQKNKLEQKNLLNLSLEKQVGERTLSLKLKNDELETLDRIVFAINRETDLGKLLPALLDQALTLFPSAEKGGLLLWDEGTECFRKVAAVGFAHEMKDLTLTRQELRTIVEHNAAEKADDLWLAETVDLEPYPNKVKHLIGARSILAMGLVLEDHMEAVLFLSCYSRSHAFDQTDVATLQRLREHALSALAKAKLLQKLKEKTLAILRTQQQLLIQEKMASLGTLTAGIAHEINNPTNYAYGGAQNLERELVQFQSFLFNLLDDESEDSFREEFKQHMDPLFQHAATIKEGAQRIMTIVRDLHTFSHEGGAAKEHVILSDHIQSAVNLVRGEFKERVQFDLNLEDRFVAYCCPAEINQVILNLLTNGCQAILKKQDEDQDRSSGLLKVTTFKEDEKGVVLFHDNGCGMTEKMRRKIFEPFFTTNRVGQGAGLGLASSYNMIRKMGGSLEVASKLDMGSTITLKLPLTNA